MVNDPGLYRNLVNETDIYTVDAYPLGKFTIRRLEKLTYKPLSLGSSCTGMQAWRDIPTTWRPYHEEVMPNTPFMFTECVHCPHESSRVSPFSDDVCPGSKEGEYARSDKGAKI